ncbi:hypothetical protein CVT25_013907 [Psilocybe cyanescens]|uniref:Uncharacterized protein n=1 Tax=Psilocybe cyanescens TaxID=93625 RepID=A0A409WBZ8_PSICY|nr:hypothetical protein CVT25_013907 [Psilocybe cyanescens]
MGALSINTIRLLCTDLGEARRHETVAIDHAAQLQALTLALELRLSETIQVIAHNSPSSNNALIPLFDSPEALRRAVTAFSLFDNFEDNDSPLRNLSELLQTIPSHHFGQFPQLLELLCKHGYLDVDGNFVPPAPPSSVDHPMLNLEGEEASSGEESTKSSTESGSSDSEEDRSSKTKGSPKEDRPSREEESSGSEDDDDDSEESEDEHPPLKKARLTY